LNPRPICVLGAKLSDTRILLKSGGTIQISPDSLYPLGTWYYYQILDGKIIKALLAK